MRWQNPMIPTVQTQIRETVARVSRDPIEISTPGTGEQRNRGYLLLSIPSKSRIGEKRKIGGRVRLRA